MTHSDSSCVSSRLVLLLSLCSSPSRSLMRSSSTRVTTYFLHARYWSGRERGSEVERERGEKSQMYINGLPLYPNQWQLEALDDIAYQSPIPSHIHTATAVSIHARPQPPRREKLGLGVLLLDTSTARRRRGIRLASVNFVNEKYDGKCSSTTFFP